MVPGCDGERIWDTGAGIILRLGTRSPGGRIPPRVVASGGEWSGKERALHQSAQHRRPTMPLVTLHGSRIAMVQTCVTESSDANEEMWHSG